MIHRFLMLSDEVDNFRREYRLDSDATFLDLYNVILESVGYEKRNTASFFICADDWTRKTEISLFEKNTKSEVDCIIMKDALLNEYLEDERQKLIFVFDHINDRAFYMELREIIPGESLDKAIITKSVGKPPVQSLPVEEEELVKVPPPAPISLDDDPDDYEHDDYDEDSYTEDDYNDDELDPDGFDELDREEGGDDDVNIDELDM